MASNQPGSCNCDRGAEKSRVPGRFLKDEQCGHFVSPTQLTILFTKCSVPNSFHH